MTIHSNLELVRKHTETDNWQLYIYACVVPTAFLPHGFGKKQELDSAGTTNINCTLYMLLPRYQSIVVDVYTHR